MTISEYHRLVVEALAAEPDEVVLIELAKQAQQLSDLGKWKRQRNEPLGGGIRSLASQSVPLHEPFHVLHQQREDDEHLGCRKGHHQGISRDAHHVAV